ncbi:transcriptional regulator, LacI family [Streptomyces zhaozhouensis]|uniref:Transcriptional regulator, LacI family n=1 Tax=Streptomyces zhaozhouensis TaxID=1300267 RepID=A0A286DZS4_9ACTN|nr:LacI family DNA-binding transcriptional regulator [Streptomyces zhaozhouensis]SOD64123.1 transcriptional regulator, LacI family [Streptomyces zhaozhouensis]
MTSMDSPPQPGAVDVVARPTLDDVARLAEVSRKTVSRVMSGGQNVAPATRDRVLRAARALRFRPNAVARDLRTGGTSRTVAFVIGDLTNPFYASVASGVERALARQDLTMLLAATEDLVERESQAVTAMLERRVRALLLVPIADDHSYLDGERELGTPIVAVDRPLSHAVSDLVTLDNRGGAAQAVRALVDAGHRRVAFVGSSSRLRPHAERRSGYEDVLRAAGIPADPELIRQDAADVEGAEAATRQLLALPDPPTAVFTANNRATAGAARALRAHPSRVVLFGFDDFELAEAMDVSVVAYDPTRMGEAAAELALERLGRPSRTTEQVTLPTYLRTRGDITPAG